MSSRAMRNTLTMRVLITGVVLVAAALLELAFLDYGPSLSDLVLF